MVFSRRNTPALLCAAEQCETGEYGKALNITGKLLLQGVSSLELLDLHARAACGAGELQVALASITKAIKAGGATVKRAMVYGDILLRLEKWAAAADVFNKVTKEEPDNYLAWLGLGHCLYATNDAERAAKVYQRTLDLRPGHEEAAARMAECFLYVGQAELTANALFDAVRENPGSARLKYWLGEALRQCCCAERALEVLEQLQGDEQWGAKAERSIIMVCLDLEKFDLAWELTNKHLAINPDDVGLIGFKARLLAIEGEIEQARLLYETLLDLQPDNFAIWGPYCKLLERPLPENKLATLIEHKDRLEKSQQKRHLANLYYALYWHYSLADDVAKEILWLDRANSLMSEIEPFDSVEHSEAVKELREGYDRSRIQALTEAGDREFQGVFILCPPRSGSTLLEQALARHPRCWSGGEKAFSAEAWKSLVGNYGVLAKENISVHRGVDKDFVRQFAASYLSAARQQGWIDGRVMIHKGIDNYKFAGLLRATFPNAIFLELVRDPLDVAFGCYRQNFNRQPFSATFSGCAAELALYRDSMSWWGDQMGEAITTINYEDLVDEFEGWIRTVLEKIGLDWDPACVDFDQPSRVSTASIAQVRGGLKREGLGRARRYGAYLGQLKSALQDKGFNFDQEGLTS